MITTHVHRSYRAMGEAIIVAGIGFLSIAVSTIKGSIEAKDFSGIVILSAIAAVFITIGVLIIRWDKRQQAKKAQKEKEMK